MRLAGRWQEFGLFVVPISTRAANVHEGSVALTTPMKSLRVRRPLGPCVQPTGLQGEGCQGLPSSNCCSLI